MQPVLRVTVVDRVPKAIKERRVPLEPKAHAVHAESKVLKVSKVRRATREPQARKEHAVTRVRR